MHRVGTSRVFGRRGRGRHLASNGEGSEPLS
jgi:hypothetical protein